MRARSIMFLDGIYLGHREFMDSSVGLKETSLTDFLTN